MKKVLIITLLIIVAAAIAVSVIDTGSPNAQSGSATTTADSAEAPPKTAPDAARSGEAGDAAQEASARTSTREIRTTDGTKHSIPLDEILTGAAKDGIPSIDEPEFDTTEEAQWLNDTNPGLGLVVNGDARFYPYRILVWHEIVNDTVGGKPVLVTYCPLCATGVVFERKVEGEVEEFGVSGKLWQSNLLMYNRGGEESLWSQVLGEAVVGPHTGTTLNILRSDVVRYGDWKAKHPGTKVLSRKTGASRNYGRDPYGDTPPMIGAEYSDTRLDPYTFVFGITIDGKHKAYPRSALPEGRTTDTFANTDVIIEREADGRTRFSTDGGPDIPHIGGYWFSWAAAHPDTELFTNN